MNIAERRAAIPVKKTLADFPEIAAEFDIEANSGITPDQVSAGSHKKYWWRCTKGPDHVWEAAPGERTGKRKTGCPCCSGRRLSVTNSLVARMPEVAVEFDVDANGGIAPDQVIAGSHKKYWWRCTKAQLCPETVPGTVFPK